MIFRYEELKKFLKIIKKLGVKSLQSWNGENAIILRHDVDFDIQAAYDLALIEKKIGVESSFFIMTTSDTYNPLTRKNRNLLKKMAEMGFDIGLHFDPSIYEKAEHEELSKKAQKEASILELIVGQPVNTISIHNPSVHKQLPLFDNFINAYDPKIFSSEKYISDSRMSFRTDIYEFIKNVDKSPVQVLLHPLYYTSDGKKLDEIIYKFVCDFIIDIDRSWKDNSAYVSMMNEDLLTFISHKIVKK